MPVQAIALARDCLQDVYLQRFLDNLMPEPNSGCLLWLRSVSPDGYGFVFDGRRLLRAHRVAYAREYGEAPADQMVLHKCDTPSCCEPTHLFLGTQTTNMQDMAAKGRAGDHAGEANARAILTEDDVRFIRAQPRGGRWLAERFGVTYEMTKQIRRREAWTHI